MGAVATVLAVVGGLMLLTSLLPYILWHYAISFLCKDQDLRKRYDARWALVTGASSGIGRALAIKCATQGLNVVLVARPDSLLDDTHDALTKQFRDQDFRKVAVDLGTRDGPDAVASAIKDIACPQVCFLNAGFVQTGFFNQVSLAKHFANLDCNVGHVLALSHLLVNRLLAEKKRGCLMFTSSAAALMPSPFVCLYGSTKAFLSTFGASLAAEVRSQGIDVTVFHPSPVASNFASSADHQIDLLDQFNKLAVPPEALPDAMFGAMGRCVYRDFGLIALVFRLVSKLVDFNLLAWLTAATAHTIPDFKKHWQQPQASGGIVPSQRKSGGRTPRRGRSKSRGR